MRRTRLFLLGISFLYIVGIQLGYVYLIGNRYGQGYFLLLPSFNEVFLASIMAWMPVWIIPIRLDKPSVSVSWLLYLMAYVPSIVLPSYTGVSDGFWLWRLFALMGCLIVVSPVYGKISLPSKSVSPLIYKVIVGGIFLLVGLTTLTHYGVRFHLPTPSEVYKVRYQYKTSVHSRWIGYAVEYLGNVFGAFAIAFALTRRRVFYFAIGLWFIIWEYSITAFKSVLFLPLMLLGIWLLALGKRRKYFGLIVVVAYIAIIVVSFVTAKLFDLFHPLNLANIFFRRMLVVPGIVAGYYFSEFHNRPPILFSNGLLGGIFEYPFSAPYQQIIAHVYFGYQGGNAVGNIWADAYVQLGLVGILLMSVILRGLLEVIDAKWHSSTEEVVFASLVLSIHAFTLSNTSLQTTLLSHGLLLSSILLLLMPVETKQTLFGRGT